MVCVLCCAVCGVVWCGVVWCVCCAVLWGGNEDVVWFDVVRCGAL